MAAARLAGGPRASVDPGRVRELLRLAALGGDAEDVVVVVEIAGEGDPAAVRGPARLAVLDSFGEQHGCLAGGCVQHPQVVEAVAVGHEGQAGAVGRPARLGVAPVEGIGSEGARVPARRGHDPDVLVALRVVPGTGVAGESEHGAVGGQLAAAPRSHPLDLARLDIHGRHRAVPEHAGVEVDPAAVGRPRDAGVVQRVLGKAPWVSSSRRHHVDVTHIGSAEVGLEGDPAPVGAEARGHLAARHRGDAGGLASRRGHAPEVVGPARGGLEDEEAAVGRDVKLLDPHGLGQRLDGEPGTELRRSRAGRTPNHQRRDQNGRGADEHPHCFSGQSSPLKDLQAVSRTRSCRCSSSQAAPAAPRSPGRR